MPVQSSPVQSSPVQSSPVRDSVSKSRNSKALIVTIIAPGGNYGNILQHYALQETVKSLGYEVDSIDCPLEQCGKIGVLEKSSKLIDQISKVVQALTGDEYYRERLFSKLTRREKHLSSENNPAYIVQREELFQEFYREYFGNIIHSTYREALTSNSSTWNEYDYVIAGSDQIWNRGIIVTFEALRYYYLEFIEQSRRVNYAPSFGVSSLNFLERLIHRKGLNGFKKLSCREEEGCDLIRSMTGREAQLVLDPALLFTAEQWRKIARKPEYEVPEHYVLEYFFSDTLEPCVKRLAGDLPIVRAFDERDPSYAKTGPREFVWLVDHADFVITASFHGTAFSVILGKRFISFKSRWGFSRIRTLLSSCGLTDRIVDLDGDIDSIKFSDKPIDYEAVNSKLQTLREESMKYLASCLGK